MTDLADEVLGRDAAWAQFPEPVRAAPPTSVRVPDVAVAAAVVAAAPLLRAWSLKGFGVAALVAACGCAAAVAVERAGARRLDRWIAAAVVAGAAVLSAAGAGRPVAVSLVVGAGVAGLALRPDRRSARERAVLLRVAAGPAVLAGVVGWRDGSTATILAIQGVSLVAVAAGWPTPELFDRVDRALRLAIETLLGLVRHLVFLGLGLLAVVLPWIVQRPVHWDPTWTRRAKSSRLVPLRARRDDSDRQWTGSRPALRPGWRRSLHRLAVVVPILAIAIAARVLSVPIDIDAEPARAENHALDSSTWWGRASEAQQATYNFARVSAYLGPVLADVRTKYTNVVDGHRATWQPPAAPRLTVWFFGGSAGFGLGQRDDHTIASELARAAWADGLPIEVVNWAVHGDVHWMEWNRLHAALIGGTAPPDLVVFYDGYNDLGTVGYVNNEGRAATLSMLGSMDSTVLQRRELPERILLRMWSSLGDNGLQPPPPRRHLSTDEVVDAAVRQYGASINDSSTLLDQAGVPAAYFYQPSRVTRAEPVPGEAADEDDRTRRMERSFRDRRPARVVDLSAAMDDTRQPVYFDTVHTNELGARVVGDAIFRHLAPQLHDLAGKG